MLLGRFAQPWLSVQQICTYAAERYYLCSRCNFRAAKRQRVCAASGAGNTALVQFKERARADMRFVISRKAAPVFPVCCSSACAADLQCLCSICDTCAADPAVTVQHMRSVSAANTVPVQQYEQVKYSFPHLRVLWAPSRTTNFYL